MAIFSNERYFEILFQNNNNNNNKNKNKKKNILQNKII